MQIKIEKFEPSQIEVTLEQCGGERCGNCEPSCETCCEKRSPDESPTQLPVTGSRDFLAAA